MEADWEGGDEDAERPYGGRPYGGRPYGGRPYGGRPYGGRPYGGRPYGGRPYGGRPYGGRPYGGRPYGGRPYGGRPYGGRRSSDDGLDLEEWNADIGDLVCDRSALLQLGATVVPVEDQLWVPGAGVEVGFRPAPPPPLVDVFDLDPSKTTIEAAVAIPSDLAVRFADEPEVALPIKADLAEAIANAMDSAALLGPDPPLAGLSTRAAANVPTAGDLLATLRDMLEKVLAEKPAFRNAGWILHPQTVDHVARIRTTDGLTETAPAVPEALSLAQLDLFRLDSARQGMLLGVPFMTSGVAVADPGPPIVPRLFLAADWDLAWIGVAPSFVEVDRPGGPPVAGARVIRASMPIDVEFRHEEAFAWAD